MDIKELHSFKLSDAVKFHDKLNPKLWFGERLDPAVRKQLLVIAKDFMSELGIHDLAVDDITVSGSNAAYTYTPHSDLDLHILVDMSKLMNNDVYQELFNAKKTLYNDSHDIKIKGVPVELYVQDSNEPVVSLGEYSVLNNQWIKRPTKRRANLDQNATRAKFDKLAEMVSLALKTQDLEKLNKVIKNIKRYRQAGLDKGGEFSPENLAYKALRSQGQIDKLYNLRDKLHSELLSIDEMYRNPVTIQKEEQEKTFKASQVWNYVKKIHPADQQGDGFLKSLVINHPKWELKHVPLNQIRIPDPYAEDDFEDAYNRVLDIDMYHVNDITSHDINKRPIVIDTDGFVIDGNHRALSARLRGMKTIPAYVPVGKLEEKVNYDLLNDPEPVDQTVDWNGYKFRIQNTLNGVEDTPGVVIKAYDPKNLNHSIGKADFVLHKDKKGAWIESNDTEVDDEYQGKGIATMMYAVAKSMGFDVRPSPYQSNAGRQMWKKWGSDAKNLMKETFDKPYPLKWEKSEYGDVDALATLPDGAPLSIMFEHTTPYEVHVSFYRNNSLEVTGEGDSQRVFATVLHAIQEFLKMEQPANISFSASKEVEPGQNSESRAKLYNRLVQRYANAWGYKFHSFDHGDEVVYELSRIKQDVSEASGYIPTYAQRNDPRFEKALTVDVHPDTMKKGAKKFGWNISRAGIPPTAKPNGKI